MKTIMGLFLLLGLGVLASGQAEAASAARGAKYSYALNYTTAVSTVAAGPAVVYQVTTASGTAGTDFIALFDAAAPGVLATNGNASLKTRVIVSSATQNTVVTFDPPLQFNNGIVVGASAAGLQALITYERGRVVSGY